MVYKPTNISGGPIVDNVGAPVYEIAKLVNIIPIAVVHDTYNYS